jgi:hypothetical protein
MPGMIIPELVIDFAGTLKMKGSVQVIYRLVEKIQPAAEFPFWIWA